MIRVELDTGALVSQSEIVSSTRSALSSQAVMARVGSTHDPVDDVDYPLVPERSRLRRHNLDQLRAERWAGPPDTMYACDEDGNPGGTEQP